MTTRREGDINATGFGTGASGVSAPAVPVPVPATGAGASGGVTGMPVYGPNTAPNGATYTPAAGGQSAQNFITNFSFANAQPGTAQYAFNQIKQKYGANAAFSYAMKNWAHFSSYDPAKGLYGAMAQAGVNDVDQKRLINAYGSSRSNDLGEGFNAVEGGLFGQDGYNVYGKQFFDPNSQAAQGQLAANTSAFQNQMANGGYDYFNQPNANTSGGVFSTVTGGNPSGDANAFNTFNGASPATRTRAFTGATVPVAPATPPPTGPSGSSLTAPVVPIPKPAPEGAASGGVNSNAFGAVATPTTTNPIGSAPRSVWRYTPQR